MKNTLQLIKNELISDDCNFPILTVCKLTRLYINKDLISFINRLLSTSADPIEREKIAFKLKKLVLQEPRLPDPDQLKAQPDEFRQFFIEIETEQAFYDPIKWLDAELEYIRSKKQNTSMFEAKSLLNKQEVMQWLNISISTLSRMISEGLKPIQRGHIMLFHREELIQWLRSYGND